MFEWRRALFSREQRRYVTCDTREDGERDPPAGCHRKAPWPEGEPLPEGWRAVFVKRQAVGPSTVHPDRHMCPVCFEALPESWRPTTSTDPVGDELDALFG